MLNQSEIVQSAISSFNNASLYGPEFFWVALASVPIFFVFWKFGHQIAQALFRKSDISQKINFIADWSIILTGGWLLVHGSYNSLRNFSVIPIVMAFCIFVVAAFVTRFMRRRDIKILERIKVKDKFRRILRYALPILAILGVGLCGEPTLRGFILQSGAAAFGVGLGFALDKYNRQNFKPESILMLLIGVLTFGISMQPEFFRFGQLGRLTALHLVFLSSVATMFIIWGALRYIRPKEWLSVATFKRANLFFTLAAVLSFAIFIFTESSMMFALFLGVFAIVAILNVLHRSKTDAKSLHNLSKDFFLLTLGLFGILIIMPVFTAAAVLLWRITEHDKSAPKIHKASK